MAGDAAELGTADWREASAEARGVLQVAIRWRLEASGWLQVQDALEGMEAAVAVTDAGPLWTEIARLEQLGPFRVSMRLGDPPKEPVPEGTRERINVLIDALVPDDGQAPRDQDPDRGHGAPTG